MFSIWNMCSKDPNYLQIRAHIELKAKQFPFLTVFFSSSLIFWYFGTLENQSYKIIMDNLNCIIILKSSLKSSWVLGWWVPTHYHFPDSYLRLKWIWNWIFLHVAESDTVQFMRDIIWNNSKEKAKQMLELLFLNHSI